MIEYFNVGKIVNTHGVRGEVRVIATTDFAEDRFAPGNTVYMFSPQTNEPKELVIHTRRKHKNFELLTFKGYSNVNEVEPFKGNVLKITAEQQGALEENEFYFHEIIGCEVVTVDGETIGRIYEILTPGANDVWVVKSKGGKDVLIPYIEQIVKKVDVKEKVVLIEPMEGLLS